GCGDMSVSSTSLITSTLSPPRIGSGHTNTGRNTQSDALPGAWFVLDPSKPQIGKLGRSALPVRTFVFDRRRAVGSVPSIQMYSPLIPTLAPVLSQPDECPAKPGQRQLSGGWFLCRCLNMNPLLPGPAGRGDTTRWFLHCAHGAPARVRPAHGRGARRTVRPPLV